MKLTILGSGGCTVIPKPLCRCRICEEAREKGGAYQRTGPSAFIHDEEILIDTPAEISLQLNRSRIRGVKHLLFTHLDPDHVEGFRVVEQVALDFRSWQAYAEKQIRIVIPEALYDRLSGLRGAYGPMIDFFLEQGFVRCEPFRETTRIGEIAVTAVPVSRGSSLAFIYAFEKGGRKVVYAPCDVRPFPEQNQAVHACDLLVIQPGIFEHGLKHDFVYPKDHGSRSTLYTFAETLALAHRIRAARILFVHLEEYWNRSYDDYVALEKEHDHIAFAYDGMEVLI
jgi:phosphoribosyl 1,2-cyclic phosphate phosphodiesterase